MQHGFTPIVVRFSSADIDHAMARISCYTGEACTRDEALRIVHDYDDSFGDIDDLLDRYENDPGY